MHAQHGASGVDRVVRDTLLETSAQHEWLQHEQQRGEDKVQQHHRVHPQVRRVVRGMRILLCEANERVLGKLRRAGVLDVLRQGDYGADFRAVLAQAVGVAE